MSFGMKRDEIITKVKRELGKPRGGLQSFNDLDQQSIAEAIATVITENNNKIMHALEEADIEF